MSRQLALLLLLSLPAFPADNSPQGLIRNGHFKRARALADERYRANPNDPETLWLMSNVKLAWKDYDAAVQFAEKAVAADPKSARYHFQLAEAVGEVAQRASVLKQLGLARRFKKEVDAALALDPHHAEALDMLMEYYLHAPGIAGGDKTKARAIPAQIKAFDPAKGYFAEISLVQFEKQNDKVEGLLRQAVEAAPASYEAHVSLGNVCAGQKKFTEAEALAREAIKIDADRAAGHGLLAVALVHQQKWTELDAALAEGEKQVPDNLNAYMRAAANCLVLKTELPRAERYIRKYLAQEPEPNSTTPAIARWRLAQALEQQGRKDEAIAEYQASVKLNADSPAKADLKRLK